MRSIEDDEFCKMCFGCDISSENPYSQLIDSICVPSLFAMSWIHQILDVALKSSSRIIKAES